MNMEADILTCRLAEAGLYVTSCSPMYSGGQQYRYTLRKHSSGLFIAFFCWYEKLAVERSFNPKPREVKVTTEITRADVSSVVHASAVEWLQVLHRRHPIR